MAYINLVWTARSVRMTYTQPAPKPICNWGLDKSYELASS